MGLAPLLAGHQEARIEILQGEDFGGLLPIAVRVPKPVSAAAIWIDETTTNTPSTHGDILAAKWFKETCVPPPTWAAWDSDRARPLDDRGQLGRDRTSRPALASSSRLASVRSVPARPTASTSTPTPTSTRSATRAGRVKCYTTESGERKRLDRACSSSAATSPANSDPQPDLESVWLDSASGTQCYQGGYFSAPVLNSCTAVLHADVDSGAALPQDTEVRYKLIAGDTAEQEDDPPAAGGLDCGNNFQPDCSSPRVVQPVP